MRRPTKACPFCETPRPLRRLQGRAHPRPLHHRSRQDPAEPPERRVRAAPASAEHRDQARALPRDPPVHAGSAGLSMQRRRVPRRRSERGWGKLLLALAAFLFLPHLPPLRALLPVEETLLLLLPALAACCLVGWWAGGRLLLAVVWVGLAAWVLAQPATPGAFYNLVRGWSLLLAGAFGLVCLFGPRRPFFPRALRRSVAGARARAADRTAWPADAGAGQSGGAGGVRASQRWTRWRRSARSSRSIPRSCRRCREIEPDAERVRGRLKATSKAGAGLFPSLLLLESLDRARARVGDVSSALADAPRRAARAAARISASTTSSSGG